AYAQDAPKAPITPQPGHPPEQVVGGQPAPVHGGGYCPTGECDSQGHYGHGGYFHTGCGTCCGPCQNRGGFSAGIDLLYLQPRLNRDPAFFITRGGAAVDSEVTFDRDYEFSPRIWLGYTGSNGMGGRIRYWEFDDDTSENFTIPGAPAGTFVTTNVQGAGNNLGNFFAIGVGNNVNAEAELEMDTFDIEVTHAKSWCDTAVIASIGVRHANIEQSYRIVEVVPGGGIGPGGTLRTSTDLDGWGPTIGFDLVRSVGQGGLGVFFSLRGSLLAVDREGSTDSLNAAGVVINSARTTGDDFISTGEFGLGVQYGGELGSSTGVFVRAGYEAQLWTDVGGPLVIDDGDLALHGLIISIGVSR
ncbi:MAG: Lpg1974 family pore-forming outer membrane protein, partial [Planctomycetaceae bacterium]